MDSVSFDPITYVPARRREVISLLPVFQVMIVRHEKISWGSGYTNHWCLYLKTSGSTAVMVDCQPSHSIPSTITYRGSKAVLIISELDRLLLPDAIKVIALPAKAGLTVKDIIVAFMESGRHRYEFTSDGVGCRKWVFDQIDLLQSLDYIASSDECHTAREAILRLWPDGSSLLLDAGVYY